MGMTLEHQLQVFSGREEVADLVADYRKYNRERHDELVGSFLMSRKCSANSMTGGLRLAW